MGSERHKDGPQGSQKERPRLEGRLILSAVLWAGGARGGGGAGNKPKHLRREHKDQKELQEAAPGHLAEEQQKAFLEGDVPRMRVLWGSVPPQRI